MTKNIIHLALGKANPERLNGVNKVVNSLVSSQVKNGFNATFWGISFSSEHNYPTRNYTTRLFLDHANKFKLDSKLKEAINELDPEKTIFHIHGAFIPQFYALSRLLKKRNIPYFYTPHGGYNLKALEKSKWVKKAYILLFERTLVNNAIGVQLLGNSETIGAKKYFNNTFHLIPNGQELNKFAQKEIDQTDRINVGFLGRIDIHTKGLDILLVGLKIATAHMNVHLEIIGAGGEIDLLKERVDMLGLKQHVSFKGALFGDEKFKSIAAWDGLCLTSRNEGMPGVVLEAASVGVPSLVTEETNMGDSIRKYNAGWVLEKLNPESLYKALKKLHLTKQKGKLHSYSEAAISMLENEFDWNVIAKRLIAVYE